MWLFFERIWLFFERFIPNQNFLIYTVYIVEHGGLHFSQKTEKQYILLFKIIQMIFYNMLSICHPPIVSDAINYPHVNTLTHLEIQFLNYMKNFK